MFAVIYIQNFALQSVLRLEPELRSRPVALIDAQAKPPVVMQVTGAARDHGVEEGLTATQAMARCGDVVIKNRSLAREQSATEILLQIAFGFSPNIESTAAGVCSMDLMGLVFENDEAARRWAEGILQALAQMELRAQIGFAQTPGLALIAAQAAAPILLEKDPRRFVLGLPVEALQPPPEIARILALWGVRSIGSFLALGKNAIAERLGPEATALLDSLDFARPLKIVSPPETFAERVEFEHEIETTEPLLFVLQRMIEQLTRRLGMIYLVVDELELQLDLSSGATYNRPFKIPAPTNNLQVLFRMLQTHLETLRTDASIIALRVRAQPGRPEPHQFGLFETTLRNPNQFAETVARLAALCGPENFGVPQLETTHRPDAFHMAAPDFSKSAARAESSTAQIRAGLQLRRFRPALEAHVEFREHRPSLIRSKMFNGVINAATGPFLTSGDWWDAQRWTREEWDAQTADGALCRIVHSGEKCFVEGVYD